MADFDRALACLTSVLTGWTPNKRTRRKTLRRLQAAQERARRWLHLRSAHG